ncbi:MAG: type IV pilus twitching motility protein PilT [Candidatus Peregrinibacteria bacterium]
MDLTALMRDVILSESPDLHLQVGQPPVIRLKTGFLSTLEYPPLTEADIRGMIAQITSEDQKKRFAENHELDFSHHVGELSRFRVNIYEERNGPAIAFRVISEKIPGFEELGLTETIGKFTTLPHGLVLVTGTTCRGKTTTLASIVNSINQTQRRHIITIEDPIEFVYPKGQSLVTQREVNVHTHTFANAIRSALRQDPDVVMVGEMRDLETIAAAITLAETGHLVFSTLHTSDAAQTVDRIIDVFPPYQQQQIRAQLAGTLKGVVSQVLIPRADGQGRVAAREVMVVNDAIRNCIAKGETHQIYSMIQLGASEGMVLLDQHLLELVRQGFITPEEGLSKADDIETFQGQLNAILQPAYA